MKNISILIFAGFILSLFTINAQPRLLIVGGDTVNWGKVRLDESPVKHRLKLINIGDENLVFKSVNPSCGCTTAPIDKNELIPGDSAFIDITFNLPNFKGLARKGITISTNDPKSRSRLVYLFVDVVFPLKFFPSQMFTFPGLLLGDTMTSRVVMTNTTDIDITIKQVKIKGDFSTNLKNDTIVKANSDITIDVKAIPHKIGAQYGELIFKTTHPDVVRVKIPIVLNVLGEVPKKEEIPKY